MMEYEIFKERVAETMKDYLPEEYKNMQVVITPVNKINRTMDGLMLQETGKGSESAVSPTIYIENMYETYKKTGDFDATVKDAVEIITDKKNEEVAADFSCNKEKMKDPDYAKEHVIFQFVNSEQNREMLTGMPHREFLDLSIVYRLVLKTDEHGIASALVSNTLAGIWGFTESQLFQLAIENTARLLPPCVKSMHEVLLEMSYATDIPQEVLENMTGFVPADELMYVITNSKGINGSISMLYESMLHDLAEKLDSDLYILPSSIHEVIAVSTIMGNPEDLSAMVVEVNNGVLDPGDKLSDHVYYYDRNLRKLTFATNTSNHDPAKMAAVPVSQA